MIKLEIQGFTILCESLKHDTKDLTVTGYEGSGAVLDLSTYTQIRRIERKAFLSCKSIKRVKLPESIEWIDDWAFSKCTNLQTIEIGKGFDTCIFGKGVLEGCTSLTQVSFLGFSEQMSALLALTAWQMPNEHLLRSSDLGEPGWFHKWDIAFLAFLQENDEEKQNCFLCFQRLKYDFGLEPSARAEICRYIQERSFESNHPVAWTTLLENCTEDLQYFSLYLSIVQPTKAVMERMIANINATRMQVKAFLINEASKLQEDSSFLDGLFL